MIRGQIALACSPAAMSDISSGLLAAAENVSVRPGSVVSSAMLDSVPLSALSPSAISKGCCLPILRVVTSIQIFACEVSVPCVFLTWIQRYQLTL